MYAQYDLETKQVVGFHILPLDYEGNERKLEIIPDNLVDVPIIYEEEIRLYYRVITIDDSDPQNKSLVIPEDIISAAAMYDLIQTRTEEGEAIVRYLESYLNALAGKYGYKDYHAGMIFKDSTVAKYQEQGLAFYACAEAIWDYFDNNKDSFAATGHPNLEEVKAAHPKFETFKTW